MKFRNWIYLSLILAIALTLLRYLPEKQAGARQSAASVAKSEAVRPAFGAGVRDRDVRRTALPDTARQEFQDWLARFLQATDSERAEMAASGLALARARRQVFKELIARDPQRALMEAVPMVVRQKLPPSIVALLEERISARGVLRQYLRAPEPGNNSPAVVRVVETEDGRTLQAFVYGRHASTPNWIMNGSFNGVAMDGQLAVNESPIRVLEVGEVADPNKKAVEVCPISGTATEAVPSGAPVTEATPVVEAYGEIVYLCDGSHIVLYEQSLIMGEASSGGAQGFTGILPSAPTPSVGVVKVLCIPAIFADQGESPASDGGMAIMLRETGDFYQAMSYGRLTLQATITPPVVLPRNRAWYKGKDHAEGYVKEIDGLGLEMTHAKEEARKLGYDWQDYHATIVRAHGGVGAPASYGGGGNVWMRSDSTSACAHEIGHAFGLSHANFWQTNGASVIGPGGNVEYGDMYDNMGAGGPPRAHWNVRAKHQVKWLPDEFAPPITRSGDYRIHAYDTPRLEPGKHYGLRIDKDQNRTYWAEFRTLFPTNNWTTNGLLLGWNWPANGGGNLQLLDTTPGSPNDRSDAAITPGRTFSDSEAGIHITTLAVNPATNPPSLDVRVNLGLFEGNQSPSLALAPAAAVVPTNSPVTFSATADDPDGDSLAYGWIWHDNTISPNQPEVTRTFASSGIYTLSCVVSDMKGGVAIRNAVITVGSGGGGFTISGRITKAGIGIAGINVSTSGTNGTLTDSDGRYTISNLPAGTYSVTPARHGAIFTELFNNTVTVGPSFTGADFTADELPVVNITAPDALAAESGDAGTFRLHRSGSRALPLTVYVFAVHGTAAKDSDYTLSPDYTVVTNTPWQTFTIPEDAEFLDVTVTPADDAAQEGYETVTLVLGQDASFFPGDSIAATVGIVDSDTPLPRVSLSSNIAQVNEGEAAPIICTLTRTGVTTSSLDIPYAVAAGSTAVAGTDYEALPGMLTIPAGAASAEFEITPINDSFSEATETSKITITTSAAFVTDAGANSVVARIVDDDAQVLSVVASDANATEVDLALPAAVPDPGTFLLTRSGEVSGPLTVYYSVAGTALHGADYETLAGRAEFAAGEQRAVISILPRIDSFGEAPETVVLQLAAGHGSYQLGESFNGAVTIHDSGSPPLLEVRAQSTIAAEPFSSGNFRITATGTGTETLTVRYKVSGTATAGVDYEISGLNPTTLEGSAPLTLINDIVSINLGVTILDDALAEEMETIELTLLPDPSYSLWGPRSSGTMLLRDDEQPTVFVDGQIGNTGNHSVAENATSICKFWISRTGSTASPLTVNYSMVGTAGNGVDHTALSGVAVIPADAPGIDVTFTMLDDAIFEGSETVILQLQPGSYARGPDGMIHITDNEGGGPAVAFASTGGSGAESVTEVDIPVRLNEAAAVPVTVQYNLEAGARTTTLLSGKWVRIVKTGTSFESYLSLDGITFTKTGSTRVISGFPNDYLAGLVVSSGSATVTAAVEMDQVSLTGLSAGGSAGPRAAVDLAGASPAGATIETDGHYRILAGGPDFTLNGTSDGGHMVYFPISNSANCTITARVLHATGTSGNLRPGVIIRETLATDSRRFAYVVDAEWRSRQIFRNDTGGNSASSLIQNNYAKPQWLRLQRVGDVFTTYTSTNGTSFVQQTGAQTIPLGSDVLVGMAASARNDALLMQATFDNVSITPPPSLPLQGRPIGFVNEAGSVSQNGGTYVITASGGGIMSAMSSTEDEGHFLSVPVSGDFTLTARLASIQGGAGNAQAGLMVRESINRRARAVHFGLIGPGNSNAEYRARLSATTSGEGTDIDYNLAAGVLTFEPGETEQIIPLRITDDDVAEPIETVHVALSHPHQAMLGTPSTFAYTVVDDDGPLSALPVTGFAGGSASGLETETPAHIPVTLGSASSDVITVEYATTASSTASPGSDFTPVSGTLTFAPGETVQTISLPVLNDAEVEGAETVSLVLTTVSGALLSTSSVHQFTIIDDDTPVVTILASDGTATEGGDTAAFSFHRTGSTGNALTVEFLTGGTAVSGADFVAFSPAQSITIPAGQATADLIVGTLQNTAPEIDETVIVTLAQGSGYNLGAANSATVVIKDDDVNTITLTATDNVASEAGDDSGELVLTRTGPLTAELTVNFAVTGTASGFFDYEWLGNSRSFAIGQSAIVIPVTAIPDSDTEGNEQVVVSITPGTEAIVGTPSVATLTIVDDDLPPSVFISSPASKSTIIAEGNGLMLEASGFDDGLPSPLLYTWSRIFGPGTATFESPDSPATAVTFSASGVHGIRVTVDDGQFTASDVIFVQAGGFSFAEWVSQDQGLPSVRGVGGESDGKFTIVGGGTGYSSWEDSGHMLFRQLTGTGGNATIIARVTSLTGPSTRLAGITLRDTSWKSAARVNLLIDGGGNVQFRTRAFPFDFDEADISPGFTLPLWLRLERVGGVVTAATAPDVAGTAGTWTEVGSTDFVDLGDNVVVGMVASTGISTGATSTAEFDHVSVAPKVNGVALHSEDLGYYWVRGNSSVDSGITTVNGVGYHDDSGGHFRYQQVWGDCVVTARLLSQNGVPRGAQAGISIRDTTDDGPHGFYGRTSIDGFQAHWRSAPGGASGTLQTGGSIGNWVRLVRKGNSVSAFRAANSGGVPGPWVQVTGALPAALSGPILVGLVVDSNSSSLAGTGTFSGLVIEPLNTAPVVNAGPAPVYPNLELAAVVFDDGKPNPPGVVSVGWSAVAAPGPVVFSHPTAVNSTVAFDHDGLHLLRLYADDGDSRTFDDLSFTALSPYQRWLQQHLLTGQPLTGPMDDPDHDGLLNILEYALNLSGATANANPVLFDSVEVGGGRYLRMTVAKNPEATDMVFEPQVASELGQPLAWTGSGLVIETDTATLLRVRDSVPVGAGARRFMRVRVRMDP